MIAPVNVIKNTATPMAAAKIYILTTTGPVDAVVLVVERGANATADNIGVVLILEANTCNYNNHFCI
jgi:hypothetical protein